MTEFKRHTPSERLMAFAVIIVSKIVCEHILDVSLDFVEPHISVRLDAVRFTLFSSFAC